MVRRATLEDEFQKNKELKKEDLETLKDWCMKQAHLPPISDELLALFLHSCYFRLEPTKTTIDNYFTLRTHVPEFFHDRDPCKVNIVKGEQVVRFYILPKNTPQGYRVIIARLANVDPSAYVFAETCKSFLMYSDLDSHFYGSWNGFIIVFDMVGVSLGHLARLNILQIKKILYYLQEAMPVRLKGLHFVRIVPFMDKIVAMMRPFMKKELFDMMQLHTEDLTNFYKSIPRDTLPRELGGDDYSMVEVHERMFKEMKDNKTWFDQEAKLRIDESKRAGKAKDAGEIFGVEGSFKKLDID